MLKVINKYTKEIHEILPDTIALKHSVKKRFLKGQVSNYNVVIGQQLL